MGSIKEAKKAPVENIVKAIETFDSSIEPKKVIQCNAIMIPAITNLNIFLGGILIFIFATFTKTNMMIEAIIILIQTSGTACIEINSPKIPVNPAINTKK